jgi:malate dehydrogenase
MTQIGIVGGGNVGANTMFFLAEKDVAPVIMYDVKEGLSTGKALDMMEAAPVRGYQFQLDGTDRIEDVLAADVVIVAAGETRQPGESRSSLLEKNKPIVDEVIGKLSGFGGVVIVATEPVDLFTAALVEAGLPASKVIGVGGSLDSARLQVLIARELKVAQEDVKATVIGRHDDDMIALPAYCSVAGVPVTRLMSEARLAELVDEVVKAGDTIVGLAKRTNSFYGPAAVATDIAQAIVNDSNRVLSVSTVLSGQYGVSGVAMSLPAMLGAAGVTKVLEPKLSDEELARFKASADVLAKA